MRWLAPLAAAALLAGCNGGGDDESAPPATTATQTVTVRESTPTGTAAAPDRAGSLSALALAGCSADDEASTHATTDAETVAAPPPRARVRTSSRQPREGEHGDRRGGQQQHQAAGQEREGHLLLPFHLAHE